MTVKLRNVLAAAMLTLALGASGASAGTIDKSAAKLQEKSSSKKADAKSSSSAEQPRSSSPQSSAAPARNGRAAGSSRSSDAGSGSSDGGSRSSDAGSGSSDGSSRSSDAGSRSTNTGSRSGAGGSSSGASGSRSGSSSSGNVFGSLAGAAESGGRDSPDPRSGDRDRGADRDRDSGNRGGSRGLNDDLDRLQGRDPDRDRRSDNDRDRDRGHDDHDRRPPRVVERLPYGYRDYYWNGDRYYAYRGNWYRPYGATYISIGVPYGLFVTTLPGPYTSIWYGGTRYFYYDSTYYVYEPVRRGYVVSHSPYEDEDPERLGDELYVYPAQGQSEQQQADDRYECHRWAVDQTGYNPLDDEYDADRRADYLRAMTACLTGRGYTVN